MSGCTLCPKMCGVDRAHQRGFCGADATLKAAKACLHFWEEPIISGSQGSGTIFFSNCTLRCPFCQNYALSHEGFGISITQQQLVGAMLRLQNQGAHNINLVTPTHYADQICTAVAAAKQQGLVIPVAYNCGGYERCETIQMLQETVNIFLPDFKFFSPQASQRFLGVSDYAPTALAAIEQMLKQVGRPVIGSDQTLQSGVIVRHLLMPTLLADSMRCLELLWQHFGSDIYFSLMSQYTPMPQCANDPVLKNGVNFRHYQALVDFAMELGITQCFVQDSPSASTEFIPQFDLSGF